MAHGRQPGTQLIHGKCNGCGAKLCGYFRPEEAQQEMAQAKCRTCDPASRWQTVQEESVKEG